MSKAPHVREDQNDLLENGDRFPPPPPVVSLRIFFLLVAVYVTPLACALVARRRSESALQSKLEATSSVISWLIWLVVSLCLYLSQRVLARRNGWKMNEKTAAGHKEDVLRMGYLSGIFLGMGRVGARFDTIPLTFSALLIVFTFFFGFLFDAVKHYDIEFTGACLQNPATLLFATFVALVVLALSFDHISLLFALHDSSTRDSLAAVGLVACFHVALAIAPGDNKCAAHWHHWYTGALGSLFCPFDTATSHIAQAMFLGIYLHGAAFFGVEPCFSDND